MNAVQFDIHAPEPSHAKRVAARRAREARRRHRHEERCDAAVLGFRPRCGKDEHHVGRFGVRHPYFLASDAVAILVKLCNRLLIRRVGTRPLLRERERERRARGRAVRHLSFCAGYRSARRPATVSCAGDDPASVGSPAIVSIAAHTSIVGPLPPTRGTVTRRVEGERLAEQGCGILRYLSCC